MSYTSDSSCKRPNCSQTPAPAAIETTNRRVSFNVEDIHGAVADAEIPELSLCRRMHFSLHPCTIIGHIEIPGSDRRSGPERDFPQLARPAQSNPAGCLRLEAAASGLSPPDRALARPHSGLRDESADLAREKLSLSESAIFRGKSRLLKRLRQESGDLL
jgi:hypothetical protein